MPPKAKLAAPIDRPLSRAYLREFSGWSTEHPPGLSEPTSLRIMENMMTNRDGSMRIRPGLRLLTWSAFTANKAADPRQGLVGTHEVFFLNNGKKAYLYAMRETSGLVSFHVASSDTSPVGGTTPPFVSIPAGDIRVGPYQVPAFAADTTYVKYLQIDNKILALSDGSDSVRLFYVGASKSAVAPQSITVPAYSAADKPKVRQPNQAAIDNVVTNPPYTNHVNNARTDRTLLVPSSAQDSIAYNIGYFYTFSNELGESSPSKIAVIKPRRRWTSWRWLLPNAQMEPGTDETENDELVADQLFIYPSEAAFSTAKTQGARQFNVYAVMWSDQDPVPVEGVLVGSTDITSTMTHPHCWVRHTPAPMSLTRTYPLPTRDNRRNYSTPPKAAQGLVAADRMILVNDKAEGAVIRWTAALAGEYTNFTAARGGGYKTLTSGNLYIPVCVKLWQNPESKDTLTILCMGVDGYSATFYMAPAEISAQTDRVPIMGFEETTGTPGTVSPYGVEVLNNTLYHPLETELMKTTASNYNINHKTMTELIRSTWGNLINKRNIVSSQLDNRLYFLVHNPLGEPLVAGNMGNEIWVLDTAAEQGKWSRWTVQGIALRKIEYDGQVMMSLVQKDGIYVFDEAATTDHVVNPTTLMVTERAIPWKFETNTQGANRAHDAWAHLQQVGVTLGNFKGSLKYGVRGWDLNGKPVDVSKIFHDHVPAPTDGTTWDREDQLLIRRDMKEWRFYAESISANGVTSPSQGLFSNVQYRYTPVSVNVGYEHGSVETFEYGRAAAGLETNTSNGVPIPYNESRRP